MRMQESNVLLHVMKQRLASTSLQMRDEFQGYNGHNIQSHLKQAYSMYLISYTIL